MSLFLTEELHSIYSFFRSSGFCPSVQKAYWGKGAEEEVEEELEEEEEVEDDNDEEEEEEKENDKLN